MNYYKELRETEISALKSVISQPSRFRRIIYIQGQPGLGKSILSSFLRDELSGGAYVADDGNYVRYAALDFQESHFAEGNCFAVVDSLYQQMCKWPGMEFAYYELARESLYLRSGKTDLKYKIDPQNGLFSSVVQELCSSMLDFISGETTGSLKKRIASLTLSTALKSLLKDKVQDISDELSAHIQDLFQHDRKTFEEFEQTFHRDFLARTSQEQEIQLAKYFVKDLEETNQNCTAHKVIFLDTFENVSLHAAAASWIYRILMNSKANILWIVFGTDPYAFQGSAHSDFSCSLQACLWKDEQYFWPLQNLSEENSEKLLSLRGVPEGAVRNKILQIANGLPGALTLLADTYTNIKEKRAGQEPNARDFEASPVTSDLYQALMSEIYLKHLSDYQELAYGFLAELDWWDKDIFLAYAAKTNIPMPHHFFENLIRQSISRAVRTQNGTERWSLLDVPKSVFKKEKEADTKKYDQQIAYQYYREKSEQLLAQYANRNHVWTADEYADFETMCINAVHYGVLQYQDQPGFTELCEWFVEKGEENGFEQNLTEYKLYSLKETVLKVFIREVEAKDNFRFDPNHKIQMQVYYHLAWSYIYLHKYDEAIEKIMLRFSKGMILYRSALHEENIKCIYSLGVIYQRWGEYAEARFWQKIAIEYYEQQYKKFSDKSTREKLSSALNAYADILMNMQEFEESEKVYQDSLRMHGLQKDENGQFCLTPNRSPNAERVLGNYSKLFYLWGTDAKDPAKLKEAEKCIRNCILLCKNISSENAQQRESESQVRLLTIEFQMERLFGAQRTSAGKYQRFVMAYQRYIADWSGRPNYATDYMHNILNTQHNLSIAYAYAGQLPQAREVLDECIKERSIYQSPYISAAEKNLAMARKNRDILESDNPSLENLQTIY